MSSISGRNRTWKRGRSCGQVFYIGDPDMICPCLKLNTVCLAEPWSLACIGKDFKQYPSILFFLGGSYTWRHSGQVFTKKIRFYWLTNSDLVYEPKCGGGGLRGLSQWVQRCTRSPNKLWRSNSIFNLWFEQSPSQICDHVIMLFGHVQISRCRINQKLMYVLPLDRGIYLQNIYPDINGILRLIFQWLD